MKKSIIVAMASNKVIGSHNKLPWHMPADMRHFKETTKGHPVIMGRKTFESIGSKPLADRTNIILTRKQHDSSPAGCYLAYDLKEAFQKAADTGSKEVFVAGGSQIYAQALPMVDTLYITEIHAEVKGDTYFPDFDMEGWEEVSREEHKADTHHPYAYAFVKYVRKQH
jgi:dihydrofolate reductase